MGLGCNTQREGGKTDSHGDGECGGGVTGQAVAGRGSCASRRRSPTRGGHARPELRRARARRRRAGRVTLEQADADVGEPGEAIVLLLGQVRRGAAHGARRRRASGAPRASRARGGHLHWRGETATARPGPSARTNSWVKGGGASTGADCSPAWPSPLRTKRGGGDDAASRRGAGRGTVIGRPPGVRGGGCGARGGVGFVRRQAMPGGCAVRSSPSRSHPRTRRCRWRRQASPWAVVLRGVGRGVGHRSLVCLDRGGGAVAVLDGQGLLRATAIWAQHRGDVSEEAG